METDALEV